MVPRIPTAGLFCSGCGNFLAGGPSKNAKPAKSRTTAALLAFFLGGLGIHWFYLGRSGRGLLYLLFCWTGIPVVIALIDFIMFLVASDEKFAEKYG